MGKVIQLSMKQMKMEVIVISDYIQALIEYIGDDPAREGLRETPIRVLNAYEEIFYGYKDDPKTHMKVFDEPSSNELVLMKDIEFFSTCEHHMLPFYGKAHIAYITNGKVIGASKLARILDVYARRLQIQERISQQVTTALDDGLNPLGSACIIEASHLCMMCRGVKKQHSVMVTSSLTGVFRENATSRSELFQLIRG